MKLGRKEQPVNIQFDQERLDKLLERYKEATNQLNAAAERLEKASSALNKASRKIDQQITRLKAVKPGRIRFRNS